MLRTVRLLAVLLILLLGAAWGLAWATRMPGQGLADAFASRVAVLFGATTPPAASGTAQLPGGITLGGPFALTDQAGHPFTDRDLAGGWSLLYFGYTYCPDVCPTELGTMAAALDAMGPAGERVRPVFVTVDPERDTPEQLADYVARFHPRLVGLTGTPAQVAEAARRYRVYYARANRPEMTGYLMDHSSFVYLVGPDARVRLLFRPEASAESIAAAVAAAMTATRAALALPNFPTRP